MTSDVSARPTPRVPLTRLKAMWGPVRSRIAPVKRRESARALPWPTTAMVLAGLVCALTISGLLFVLSASSVKSFDTFGSEYAMFLRQLLFAIGGLVAMYLLAHFDYHRLARFRPAFLLLALLCLVAVFLPGLGSTKYGATRWIEFGPLSFQPSEFAKLALVVWLAALAGSPKRDASDVRSLLLPGILATLGLASIVVLQKDLATAVIIVVAGLAVLFLAGVPLRGMATVSACLGLSGAALAYFEPYRRERLMVLLDPARDPLGDGWNSLQSLVAIQSGGINGVGAGNVLAKHHFLPNVESDFMFAFIGEQLGLLGTMAVIVAIFALGVFGFLTAARATDRFGGLLASGLTLAILFQAAVHIGVTLGVGPPTGVPLPFISYGGTSLFMTLAAMGIILNVARQPAARGLGIGEGNPIQEPVTAQPRRRPRKTMRQSMSAAVASSSQAMKHAARKLVDADDAVPSGDSHRRSPQRSTATESPAHGVASDGRSQRRGGPRPVRASAGDFGAVRKPPPRSAGSVESRRPGRIRDPRAGIAQRSIRSAEDAQAISTSIKRRPMTGRSSGGEAPASKPLSAWQKRVLSAIRPADDETKRGTR